VDDEVGHLDTILCTIHFRLIWCKNLRNRSCKVSKRCCKKFTVMFSRATVYILIGCMCAWEPVTQKVAGYNRGTGVKC